MLWRYNGNKYLTLVPANESKEKIKKYEELCSKIRDLIRLITESSDDQGCSKKTFGRGLKVFKNVGHHGWPTKKIWVKNG